MALFNLAMVSVSVFIGLVVSTYAAAIDIYYFSAINSNSSVAILSVYSRDFCSSKFLFLAFMNVNHDFCWSLLFPDNHVRG